MITLKSYAKLNLTLDIIKKLPNNYHEIMSVMQLIDLHDTIALKESKDINIITNSNIPQGNNICYKTAKLLKEKFNIKGGVYMRIDKKMPIGSGMAGGSSNAASVIKGLNRMWNLNLSYKDMLSIASEIGKDVPFFLTKGTALVTGTGENLRELQTPIINFLIANPGFEISTKEAYSNLDYQKIGKDLKSLKMVDVIKQNDLLGIAQNLGNDFSYSIYKRYPKIEEIRDRIIEFGALNASISGSGPTVFGIFESQEKLDEGYNMLKDNVSFITKAKSIKR